MAMFASISQFSSHMAMSEYVEGILEKDPLHACVHALQDYVLEW